MLLKYVGTRSVDIQSRKFQIQKVFAKLCRVQGRPWCFFFHHHAFVIITVIIKQNEISNLNSIMGIEAVGSLQSPPIVSLFLYYVSTV